MLRTLVALVAVLILSRVSFAQSSKLTPFVMPWDDASDGASNLSGLLAALAGSPPTEAEVAASLRDIGPVWNELFPREQERIVKLLVEKVVVFEDRIEVVIRSAGLHSLVVEMGTKNEEAAQ